MFSTLQHLRKFTMQHYHLFRKVKMHKEKSNTGSLFVKKLYKIKFSELIKEA